MRRPRGKSERKKEKGRRRRKEKGEKKMKKGDLKYFQKEGGGFGVLSCACGNYDAR